MSFIDDNDKGTRQFLGVVYQTFFDTKEFNTTSNTLKDGKEIDIAMELELGAVDDCLSAKNHKILQELRDKGVFSAVDIRNEDVSKIDKYSWQNDGDDFVDASDEYLSIATCKVDESQLKSVFKEYSFYPKYFLRKYKTREIVINDKHVLSQPDFMSPNDLFFEFLYERPYTKYKFDTVLSYVRKGADMEKDRKLSNFLQDLNFVGEIKNLFFSESSKRALRLRPVIMNVDYRSFLINEDELNDQLKALPTI
jgi:hypothetical protein